MSSLYKLVEIVQFLLFKRALIFFYEDKVFFYRLIKYELLGCLRARVAISRMQLSSKLLIVFWCLLL